MAKNKTQENYNVRFDVMGLRKLTTILSAVFIVISLLALVVRGLNFGIDFTGGYIVEAGFEQPADLPPIREALASNGFGDAIVQHFGTTTEVLVVSSLSARKSVRSCESRVVLLY